MDRPPHMGLSRRTWAIIAAGLLVFLGANAHLAYVAFTSQSDCVPHLKDSPGQVGKFRAAKCYAEPSK